MMTDARRGRRGLSAGHGVDQVVDADDFQVDVAPRRVNQVIAADGEQVAVAGVDHDVQLGIRQLQSGGERNRAAVRGMERILVHVSGDAAGAADAGDDGQIFEIDLGIDQRAGEAVDAGADAASRTPDVRHAVHAQEGFDRVLGSVKFGQTSLIAPPP